MKNFVLISLILACGLIANAQLRTDTSSAATGLREARKDMEARTERTILEKLEESRLRDERNRRERFESLEFSVVRDPNQAQYPAPQSSTF
jgi:hypothetical protein